MMRLLTGLAVCLLATSALAAPSRVTDLRALSEGNRVQVLIETDAAPGPAAIVVSGPNASAQVPGARLVAFEAAPAGGPVRSMRAEGAGLSLEFARPVTSARITPVAEGLLVEADLAPASAPAPARTASIRPARAASAALSRTTERAAKPASAVADPPAGAAGPPPDAVRAALEAPARGAPPPPAAQTDGEAAARRMSSAERASQAANIAGDGLTPAACTEARDGVAADPWALDALARHGLCLLRNGDRAGARAALERIAAFDPTHAQANLGLAALDIAAGKTSEARGRLDRAMRSRDPWVSGRARRLSALTSG
jgi:hypothetical protein